MSVTVVQGYSLLQLKSPNNQLFSWYLGAAGYVALLVKTKYAGAVKIGFFGNMNNLGFSVVRYLRDLGYDAELLLFEDEAAHFHPTSDCFDLDYQKFTRSLTWGNPHRFSNVPIGSVARDIARYDQIWGNGVMPAYMQKLGRSLDVFVPYGSDLRGLSQYPGIPLRRRSVKSFLELPYRQKLGIRSHCRLVAMDRAPVFDAVLERLGFQGTRIFESVPLLYQPVYAEFEAYKQRSFWAQTLAQIRAQHELVVFHHSRHVWQEGSSLDSRKGNDKLVRAFARLVKEQKVDAHLVTTEYGPDASASKALATELGIANHTTWLPVLARREIMVALGYADLAAGDYDVGWHTGGVLFESHAAGKPIIHFRKDVELTQAERSLLAPVIPARTEDEILAALAGFRHDPKHYVDVGLRSRHWLAQNSGAQQVASIAAAAGALPTLRSAK
jgi:glycosyltransferase involved in cell wall biosynthesis